MTRIMLALISALLLAAPPTLAQNAPIAAPASSEQSLIRFERVALTCGGVAVRPTLDVLPYHAISWVGAEPLKRQNYRFRIDEGGRTLGIAKADPREWGSFDMSDLAPSIAVLRFEPGKPKPACEIAFQPIASPISQSSIADLARYYAMPHRANPIDRRVYEALVPAGSNCKTTPPRRRVVEYPDYKNVVQEPGTASYAVMRFDVGKDGKTGNVAVLHSSGNDGVVRAARKSVAGSRFDGARIGCIARFGRRESTPIAAPARPVLDALAENNCMGMAAWARQPQLTFPDNYNRRAVEGWALISFDVAPWGATGNLKVLASEPSADFGDAAKQIVAMAAKPESKAGFSGCRQFVSFKLPPSNLPDAQGD